MKKGLLLRPGRSAAIGRRNPLHRQGKWALLFLAPYLIGLTAFVAYPVAFAFYGSLTNWPIFGQPKFNGGANYEELFGDGVFWQALLNTCYYVGLLVPLELAAGLGLALLINGTRPGRNLFRAFYFAPFVLSLASIGLIWTWLYSPDFGIINTVLGWLHLPQPDWLLDPKTAMPALVIASVWRNTGYYMVIYLAGLQSVPNELYEAARVDGAGRWSRFRHITLPMLTPTTFFVGILGIILGFQVFDLSYVMTKGGPDGATITLVYYIYTTAFQRGALGYASAVAFALLVFVLLLTACYFSLEKRWVHYDKN